MYVEETSLKTARTVGGLTQKGMVMNEHMRILMPTLVRVMPMRRWTICDGQGCRAKPRRCSSRWSMLGCDCHHVRSRRRRPLARLDIIGLHRARQQIAPAVEEARAMAVQAGERVRADFPGWEVRAEAVADSPARRSSAWRMNGQRI